MDEVSPPPPRRPRLSRRRLAVLVLALAVVAAVYAFALPTIADYSDVWRVVSALSWANLLALAGATGLNVATFAPPWMVALPGLGFRQALVVTQASTASTYLAPGGAAPGLAVSFAILRAWGFRRRAVALAVALTGLWNQLVIFGFPPLALALLALSGGTSPILESFAAVGLVVVAGLVALFALAFASERAAAQAGKLAASGVSWVLGLVRRPPVSWGGGSFVRFRREAIGLIRRRWHLLTLATLAGHLSVFLVFLVCLRGAGASPAETSGVEAFAAWSIVRLLGSLPITPGGLGIVELGLTSLLVGFGAEQAEAVAATLLYRFLTVVPTLLLGLAAAATWRRQRTVTSTGVD